jgi:hypothetical protein
MGWSALITLLQQFFPEAAEFAAHWGLLPHSHGHSHGADDLGPNINAAWLAAGSIVIKEWLYRASECTTCEIRGHLLTKLQHSKSPTNANQLSSHRTPITTV